VTAEATIPEPEEEGGPLAVFRNGGFLRLWLSQAATQIGGNMVIYGLTVIILQNTNFIFTAEKQEITPNSSLATVPIGSLVEVTGIGLTETDEEGKLRALQVLIPAAANGVTDERLGG